MEQFGLLIDLGIALAAASVAGIAIAYLRQPVVLGYLIAGILIGPHALKLISSPAQVNTIAEIGVILLLFGVGIEFSLSSLKPIRNVAIYGGLLQILITTAFGTVLGLFFGWTLSASIFFGALVALSSTMVVLKLLAERGELDSTWGRIILGILIMQDLSIVPLIVILPSLAQPIGTILPQLGLAILKAGVFLLVMIFAGTKILPMIVARVAVFRSRELFLLAIVTIALTTAFATYWAGLSLALGAFIAGLVISESDFRHQVIGDISPLRDLFSALFFASIGMLVQPLFIWQNLGFVVLVVALVVGGKTIIASAVPLMFGYVGRVVPYVGLALFQMGEFSFVLAQAGVDSGVLNEFQYLLFLAVAVTTIILTPFGMRLAPLAARAIERSPVRIDGFSRQVGLSLEDPSLEDISGHAVICGMGHTGRTVAESLTRRGFKYIVIDLDPHVIDFYKSRGVPAIYGDACNTHVLDRARLDRARTMIISVPDPLAASSAVERAHQINRRLDIVVKASRPSDIQQLKDLGARTVIISDYEAGLEMLRHTLLRFGLNSFEAQSMVQHLRAESQQPGEETT